MSYFEQFLPKNESDNIMLVREDKNKSAKKNILASSVERLLESYSKSAAAKAAETKTPKVTNEKKDSFLEGFNDPYGEKEDFSRQSLAQSMVRQFASPAWQTPKTPMIKTEEPKYTFPHVDSFKNNYYGQKDESINAEHRASTSKNTSEDDAFREGFNYYNDKELMFPNTELHASPSKNQTEDDAFREGFNDPYGEEKMWKEQEESVNTFQRDMTDVAPMGRQESMWCWIAAASMVDEYYHPEDSASQQEIADQLGKNPDDGGYIEEDHKLGKGSRSYTTSGFSDRIPAKELTYEKIQKELHGKHPIVLLTDTGKNFNSEHYVVIVGCYTDGEGKRYVVVNETREDKTKKGKPGLQRHIPYEQIKGVFSTGRGADQRIKAFYTTRPEKDSYHK